MKNHTRKTPKRTLAPVSANYARQAIGEIEPGTEIYGITRGDISFTDILAYIMAETDCRDIALATWTAAQGSLHAFADMARARSIRSLRMVVDPSFVTRKPADCALIHELFGLDAIRCAPLHAKFAVATGGRLPVTLRTSMNLNPNKRIESYEISTCPDMAAYHLDLLEAIYREMPVPKPGASYSQSRKTLDAIGEGERRKTPF